MTDHIVSHTVNGKFNFISVFSLFFVFCLFLIMPLFREHSLWLLLLFISFNCIKLAHKHWEKKIVCCKKSSWFRWKRKPSWLWTKKNVYNAEELWKRIIVHELERGNFHHLKCAFYVRWPAEQNKKCSKWFLILFWLPVFLILFPFSDSLEKLNEEKVLLRCFFPSLSRFGRCIKQNKTSSHQFILRPVHLRSTYINVLQKPLRLPFSLTIPNWHQIWIAFPIFHRLFFSH